MTVKPPSITNRNIGKPLGIILVILGSIIFALGTAPQWFNLDRSPVVGFVQIGVFIFRLGLIALGGYLTLDSLWNGNPKTISAEIGARIVGTGYVIALASGMADIFGLGTRPLPFTPFFGFWQARGVLIGELLIIIGLLFMLPFWGHLVRAIWKPKAAKKKKKK